jgi:hypothetical protein
VCDALVANSAESKHIVLDPCQSTAYGNIGVQNVRRAGYEDLVEFYEEPSELALPRRLAKDIRIQVAIIDGWHTFDHTLIDFFILTRCWM